MRDEAKEAKDLGRRLKAAREAAGLNVSELARRSGVSRSIVNEIEAGQVRRREMPTLAALARACGVHVTALMMDQPEIAVEGLDEAIDDLMAREAEDPDVDPQPDEITYLKNLGPGAFAGRRPRRSNLIAMIQFYRAHIAARPPN